MTKSINTSPKKDLLSPDKRTGLAEFERDWDNGLTIEDFRNLMHQEIRKHYYAKLKRRS